jgi:peptidyl-prolyl cis-trans isomerase A (cyclophilin A)
MKKMILMILTASLFFAAPVFAVEVVVIETNRGDITVELDNEKAPISVANFLTYADSNHYDGTIFHRVIKDFMIQGGNFTPDMSPKKTLGQIKNEAGNGLRNLRGTLAMARTGEVDSATSQFFINLKDNDFLDHKDNTVRGYGYAVFGKVVKGMSVVNKIGTTRTHTFKRFSDVPAEPVVIKSVKRVAK